MFKILIGVLVVAFIAIIAFMVIDPNVNPFNGGDVTSTILEGSFTLTIEGEVLKTGTYVLNEGATMGELISTAGGLTTNGDPLCYIETAELESGMTYYIAPKYDESDVCNSVPITKVNVNSASQDTLMNVSGFTASISNSIITHRAENGQFMTIEDLLDVYGIGSATYRKVRNYVTLHE
jgi:competence protein ComEA